MKKSILFTTLILTFALSVQSQDKYEFTIIEYSTFEGKLAISKDGLEFGSEKVDVGSGFNANPLLAKVKEFQEKGWEIMSFNTLLAGNNTNRNNEIYFAYLRRKKTS
jgi:hypothetical protein